jgi:hypothetical protein
MKKLIAILSVSFALFALSAPGEAAAEDGPLFVRDALGKERWYVSGVLQEDKFYHDGMEKWISYLYVRLPKAQYDFLISREVENCEEVIDQKNKTEIQVYSGDGKLRGLTGKEIWFTGDCFMAHSYNHQRNVVMDVKDVLK